MSISKFLNNLFQDKYKTWDQMFNDGLEAGEDSAKLNIKLSIAVLKDMSKSNMTKKEIGQVSELIKKEFGYSIEEVESYYIEKACNTILHNIDMII